MKFKIQLTYLKNYSDDGGAVGDADERHEPRQLVISGACHCHSAMVMMVAFTGLGIVVALPPYHFRLD